LKTFYVVLQDYKQFLPTTFVVVAGYEPEFLQTVRHQVQRPSVGGRGPVQHRHVLPRVLGVHRRGTQERR